ncbi:rho guanine nucleotide exchange factor 18-like isoform X2 [Amphibalanus amphitrite]|uniref:rho guanine nucleotide exchange factor 18-like isoform X2 n=1 Tax=Amphibalanus amphitrite TaxID=1232801 RepID=UPI001C9071C5|nr:rho guanine nucleotide exchange factor 18-like isoform X2 [Amphibalanus amphitrite]
MQERWRSGTAVPLSLPAPTGGPPPQLLLSPRSKQPPELPPPSPPTPPKLRTPPPLSVNGARRSPWKRVKLLCHVLLWKSVTSTAARDSSNALVVHRRYTRLSSSCPSLNQESDEDPTDTLPSIQVTAHDTAQHLSALPGDDRRKSWSGRDGGDGGLRSSVSLSSLDSDADDASPGGQTRSPSKQDDLRLAAGVGSGVSVSTDELRSAGQAGGVPLQGKHGRSAVEPRSKMQKSVSTPSMLGQHRDGSEVDAGKLTGLLSNDSDDDEERQELASLRGGAASADNFIRDPSFLEDDRNKQRRKRSSIFFRKKKDKEKAKPKQTQSLTLLQRGSQAVASGRWLNNTTLAAPKVSPPIVDMGRNKSTSDMEDPLLQYDASNFGDPFDTPVMSLGDSVDDPDLKLLDEESEAWSGSVDRKILKGLTEKQIKRQEHVYEFVMTEKHHCVTLKVMQWVFAEGMRKELGYTAEMVNRLFPRLDDLIAVHMTFLRHLRERQRRSLYVEEFGDLLLDDFGGEIGDKMRDCYGEFCSKHTESVALYKDMLKADRRFQEFIRRCSLHPLLKKKGVPECILFVTHRVTKYPLLIEPLIKTSRDQEHEITNLTKALQLVKEILVDVNAQVAEKQKEARLLEIYNKIDAKSTAFYKGKKFKKSDLLSGNRRLMFEGSAALMQARGRPLLVQVIVMSDVVFFLQESNQKYHFVSQEGKAGVVSLQRLLVRDKAGGDSRGIYLISNLNEPGMYEMDCTMPRDKRIWMESISEAVKQCPYDSVDANDGEEARAQSEAQLTQVRQLSKLLKDKDLQMALLCEEKLRIQADIVELIQPDDQRLQAALGSMTFSCTHLVDDGLEPTEARQMLQTAVQEATRLAPLLFPAQGALARSASSVGEHHSNDYVSPMLPKRAETFAGFDNSAATPVKRRDPSEDNIDEAAEDQELAQEPGKEQESQPQPQEPAPNRTQASPVLSSEAFQLAALQMHRSLSTMLCVISQSANNVELLRSCVQEGGALGRGGAGSGETRLNAKLEELRNLQDRFTKEKTEWNKDRDNQEKWIQGKRTELAKLQEQLRQEQSDVGQQRELLYRQLDALRSQGILLSPNLQVVTTAQPAAPAAAPASADDESGPAPPPTTAGAAGPAANRPAPPKLKPSSSMVRRDGPPLPAHLLSSINQQKAAAAAGAHPPPVKQELPMKLAKLSALGGGGGGGGETRRPPPAGGSPSAAPGQQGGSPAGVQQMLPMKLSQDRPGRSGGGSSSAGYHRLTGGGGGTPQRQAAQRTNTYPKMPSRPTPPRRPATTTVTHLVTTSQPTSTVSGAVQTRSHTAGRPELPPRPAAPAPAPAPSSAPAAAADSEEILFF